MVKKIQIKYLIAFLTLFLFLILIGSGNVISPFYGDLNLIDEGQFAAWILHMQNGEFLYKDTYSAYGPFYIYPYYLVSKLFNPSFFLFRLTYGVFGMLISVSAVFLILNKLKVSFPLQLFSVIMLVFIPGFGLRQVSGLFAIFLTYLAFDKNRYIWSFLAGLFLSVSFLVSSDMGIFSSMVILGMFFIFLLNAKEFSIYFKKLLYFFLGSASLFFIFYFLSSSQGWFFSYTSSIFDDLISYSGIGIAIGQKFPNAFELFPTTVNSLLLTKYILSKEILIYWLVLFYILSLIYFFIKFMLKKAVEIDVLAFALTLFGILLSTILIGRTGNFTFVIPIVFILFAFFLNSLFKYIKDTKNFNDRTLGYFLIILILLFSIRLVSIYRPHFNKIPDALTSVKLLKNMPNGVGNISISDEQIEDIILIQDFINKNTKPEDKLFFLSNNPGLYLLVNRVSPTRFDLPEVANTKEKRQEIINNLEKDKTKYIIEYKKAYDVDGISNRRRLPEVMDYIRSYYGVAELGPFIIYTRKQ